LAFDGRKVEGWGLAGFNATQVREQSVVISVAISRDFRSHFLDQALDLSRQFGSELDAFRQRLGGMSENELEWSIPVEGPFARNQKEQRQSQGINVCAMVSISRVVRLLGCDEVRRTHSHACQG